MTHKNHYITSFFIDENLLRRFLGAPKSTPRPSLFLETGLIPISFIIKGRRILFLHYFLNQSEDTLINKILRDQMENPIKNDWFSLTITSSEELGLDHYSIEDIKCMKKEN